MGEPLRINWLLFSWKQSWITNVLPLAGNDEVNDNSAVVFLNQSLNIVSLVVGEDSSLE